MKRSASDLRRLVRVQQAIAAKAEADHHAVRRALAETEADLAELDAHAGAPETLRLLDLYVERTRQLASARARQRDEERSARMRHAGEKARLDPIERKARAAQMQQDRDDEQAQFDELFDRTAARANQASRKAGGA